jgi:hypothetical protein
MFILFLLSPHSPSTLNSLSLFFFLFFFFFIICSISSTVSFVGVLLVVDPHSIHRDRLVLLPQQQDKESYAEIISPVAEPKHKKITAHHYLLLAPLIGHSSRFAPEMDR